MNQMHPFPYYSTFDGLDVTLRDRDGRKIATLHGSLDAGQDAATERLLRLAPSTLITLRLATSILDEAGDHPDLVAHMRRMLDQVEPEERLNRLAGEKVRAACA